MKKRGKRTKTNKSKVLKIGIIIGIILILIILYFSFKGNKSSFKGDKSSESKIIGPLEISPLELAQNKEKYENKTVKVVNALISDPLFIYIKERDIEEKIFIKPTKSIYCLYFNVTGKLERDNTFRKWVFLVDKFDCVSKI